MGRTTSKVMQKERPRQAQLGAKKLADDEIELFKIHPLQPFQDEGIIEFTNQSLEWKAIKIFVACSRLSLGGTQYFTKGKWEHLTQLRLYAQPGARRTAIGNKGCKYLSKVLLPSIRDFDEGNQSIDTHGIFHLSKGNWKILEILLLKSNILGLDSMKNLIKTNFKKLRVFDFKDSPVTKLEMEYFLIFLSEDAIEAISIFGSIYAANISKPYLTGMRSTRNIKIHELKVHPLPAH